MVRGFIRGRAVVPAKTQIEGQLRGDSPVIHRIGCEVVEDVVLRIAGGIGRAQWTRYESANVVVIAEKHVGHGVAGSAQSRSIGTTAAVRL